MGCIRVVAPLLILGVLTGCDPLNIEEAARILGDRLDANTARVVQAFLAAVNVAEKESVEWRDLASQVRKDFRDFPPNARAEAMALIDFALDRAKDNLDTLTQITGLLERKQYGGFGEQPGRDE